VRWAFCVPPLGRRFAALNFLIGFEYLENGSESQRSLAAAIAVTLAYAIGDWPCAVHMLAHMLIGIDGGGGRY
jgi:hypothetical protein